MYLEQNAKNSGTRTSPLDGLCQDLRYAARIVRRSPGFTFFAVLILALGVGANTAMFSLTSAVLLRQLPFPNPGRLVVLWEDSTAVGGPAHRMPAWEDYVEWTRQNRSFDALAALADVSYNLTGDGEPERVGASLTTANLFSLLGIQPVLGRTFAPADEGPDASPVVVISDRLWRSRFAGNPDVLRRRTRFSIPRSRPRLPRAVPWRWRRQDRAPGHADLSPAVHSRSSSRCSRTARFRFRAFCICGGRLEARDKVRELSP